MNDNINAQQAAINQANAQDLSKQPETSNIADKNSKFYRFMHHKAHSYIAMLARYFLAYIFISACIHKLQMPESFAVDIATYQFLPLVFINPMAIMLPWIELGTGIMLAAGFKSRSAALMVAGMMIMFMIALSFALAHDLQISCGCFASNAAAASDPISFLTLLRDTSWLLIAVYVIVFDTNPIGVDRILKLRRLKQRTAQ